MAEDDRYRFWLVYAEEWNQADIGYEVKGDYNEMVLTGIISKTEFNTGVML